MRKNDIKIGGLLNFMDLPSDMKRYIRHFGLHFNYKLYVFAASNMHRKIKGSEKTEKMKPIEKAKFEELLKKYNITLQYDELYDGVFVYTMAMSDFFESSLPTEKELLFFVRDYIDDIDKVDGFVFNRWLADMFLEGRAIEWDDFI